jgi:hypothetical protein
MAGSNLTPAQARALIKNALNDGYRPSQVKNIDKVKAVLSTEQIQKTIDSTLKGSTTAKSATLNPVTNTTRNTGGIAGKSGKNVGKVYRPMGGGAFGGMFGTKNR